MLGAFKAQLEAFEAWLEASEAWLEASDAWLEASEGWLEASEARQVPGTWLNASEAMRHGWMPWKPDQRPLRAGRQVIQQQQQ